jgi:hypothetical protein
MLCTLLLGFGLWPCLLAGCSKEHKAPSTTGRSSPSLVASASQPASLRLPHGIKGLELGMTLGQVEQSFTVKEDDHPLTDFLAKYLKPEISHKDKAIQNRYFLVTTYMAKLPKGVMWADIHTTRSNKVYQIGLHYDEPSVEKIGWDGITAPYLARYGKPTLESGSRYTWADNQTRLDIKSTGSTITVYFTDKSLETDARRAERE